MEKNYLGLAGLVLAVVATALGLYANVHKQQYGSAQSPASYSCVNNGGSSSSPGGSASLSGLTSSQAPGMSYAEPRFGASSGTESSIIGAGEVGSTVSSTNGNFTSFVTSSNGGFVSASTLLLGVNAGNTASSTRSSATSTWALQGGTSASCIVLRSPTGTPAFCQINGAGPASFVCSPVSCQ